MDASHFAVGEDVYAEDLAVGQLLKPMRALLAEEGVTELCINAPGRVHLETAAGWRDVEVADVTFERCRALATAVATYCDQAVSESSPLLSATLPTGERIQIVVPPASARGTVAIAIRKPANRVLTLAGLKAAGMFSRKPRRIGGNGASDGLPAADAELVKCLAEERFADFFALAVRARRTIVVAGDTGCGKTTFVKALLEEVPREERLITIEDAAEIHLAGHANKVHLYYSQGAQGVAQVSATELLRACLRMKPDRILLGELRGPEAWDFLNVCASGHPGGMSTVHAASCALTFERLAFLVGQSPAAVNLRYEQVKRLLVLVVDIVVHIERIAGSGRFVHEIYFDPARRLKESEI